MGGLIKTLIKEYYQSLDKNLSQPKYSKTKQWTWHIFKCILLTPFVHDKVSRAELVAVKVLDGDEVIGSDPLLQPPVLPHHIGRGLCGYDLHCNAVREKTDQNHTWPQQTGWHSLILFLQKSVYYRTTIFLQTNLFLFPKLFKIMVIIASPNYKKEKQKNCLLTDLQAWTRGRTLSFSSYASSSGFGWTAEYSSSGWFPDHRSERRQWSWLTMSESCNTVAGRRRKVQTCGTTMVSGASSVKPKDAKN